MKRHLHLLVLVALAACCPTPAPCAETLPLAGPWRCVLDREDVGVAERWATRVLPGEPIELPGDLAERGLGDPVTLDTPWTGDIFDRSFFTSPAYAPYRQNGRIKVPFWLQPERHYVGAAWYQRDVEIPASWRGRRVVLFLERAHWETRVFVDGHEVGRDDSLSTPHEHVLGSDLAPGRHTLTVRVDNRYLVPIGANSHSISDHTQGNWNGLTGRLELRATGSAWIDDLQVYPHAAARALTVRVHVRGASTLASSASLQLTSPSGAPLAVPIGKDGRVEAEYRLAADAALWDEFQPALHRLTAALPNGETQTVTFGLRDVGTDGTQFTLNGRRIFLRGTLECAIFPKTGHPPTDVESWRKVLRAAQAHGLNHLRFHSWCPPEAAFVAADEMGFYLQVEAASWPNQGAEVGSGAPNDAWQVRESDRIVRAYGNHPSFLLFASGNEPAGAHSRSWLTYWLERMKAADPRRLYAPSSGWPELPAGQYHVLHQPRMHQWLDNLRSRVNARPPETRTDYREFVAARQTPVVSHEIGQWCVYPRFAEMAKYTGYLKPRNFEIFRETLAAHGLAEKADAFVHASGKLQALLYKEEIESALRTPGMGGFQLLDLHDFPGQGTALVGVLDPFWEEKGYITPAEYRRFAGPTVPLARLDRRVFTTADTLETDVEVTHFGAAPLAAASAHWSLTTADGVTLAEGVLPARDVPIGSAIPLGRVRVPLGDVPAPVQCRLRVSLPDTDAANDWDVWVYPASLPETDPANVLSATQLDDATLTALREGARVVLSIAPAAVAPDPERGKIELGFSSIFWNTAWTNQQAPHTLGLLCDPRHPALARFPTDSHSNWQWWYAVSRAGAMIVDALPRELQPIIQPIDDWVTNRRLALVFEGRLGKGRLLVSSIDLSGTGLDPVRRQLRHSLLAYAASPEFQPTVPVSAEAIRSLSTR